MGVISLASILSIIGGAFTKRNDKQYWSGWISGDGPNRNVTVTAVSFEESGLALSITDGTTEYDLKAAPKDLEHTEVFLKDKTGEYQPIAGAGMVFATKFSLSDVSRYAFDFRPIPLVDGKHGRFNMRFDTHSGI